MEDLTIPVWFLVLSGIFGGTLVSWAVWITLKTWSNDKDIALNTLSDITVKERISEVKTEMSSRIDKFEQHVNQQFDKMNGRFDKVFELLSK